MAELRTERNGLVGDRDAKHLALHSNARVRLEIVNFFECRTGEMQAGGCGTPPVRCADLTNSDRSMRIELSAIGLIERVPADD